MLGRAAVRSAASAAASNAARRVCVSSAATSAARVAVSSSRAFAAQAIPVNADPVPETYKGLTFTSSLEFRGMWPKFEAVRAVDAEGKVVSQEVLQASGIGEDRAMLEKLMNSMVRLAVMDRVLYDSQRQGRISFYMTSTGEEGLQFGCASALKDQDTIFSQYREPGTLLWRGFTLEQVCNQCCSNALDLGKGRQMPVHYGSAKHNFQTVSSPLATQIPQAAGAGYKLKMDKAEDTCVICFFGEGAASEGDFHAALNFASTLGGPTIFFCRNNGYAISTPIRDQFAGDGIATRGPAYGIETIRCDGNDVFAVRAATLAAREKAISTQKPVLIEAMTYRMGHHSTSDDASRYRGTAEPEMWSQTDPIKRLGKYMEKKGWWSSEQEDALQKETRKHVLAALKGAESEKKPALSELFTDVYADIPQNLIEQREELKAHLAKYRDEYHPDDFADGAKL